MDYSYSMTIKVRSYDLDSFGHVNNAVYLNYLEAARCEYMQQRGLSFNDFEKWGALPIVGKAEIRYKSPARADDILEIRGAIHWWRRSSFVIDYQIHNTTTDKLCATVNMVFAFVDENGKLTRVPEIFKEKMG